MCQLLGMNCNVPTDICFSFEGFAARAGLTDHHTDGWGIGFFEDGGCRTFLDSLPASQSPIAALVKQYPIKSRNVIAHIRKATHGHVTLENCHPFVREMWGKYWLFAHNGELNHFHPTLGGRYNPVGDTDSERAFCLILEHLFQSFPQGNPNAEALYRAMAEITRHIATHGIFNFLLSNGQWLFAHCSTKLNYIIREHPFQSAHLVDQDITLDFSQVTTPADRVTVIATTPLTYNESWTMIWPGELLLFQDGIPRKF
ncbi:class II glutamine amidotransferase [Desulfurispirillum indicum]|uniref:Glutamine amidotransferase class-II n=1 Tax=Desulfurispirillum indicum (strain ATCC BAA-1389 / DSM 22839 / S5) TaxID=653733 RepID=E6W5F0_DESIS|nr:class II glutamine amidotransferase [Desulfurispirillum indicum]ADU64881.1 glutamine amidotransferase class-II [Desulfurispirillum indicum S5]UCZ56814.1 class II glutamine amidotransferase [Desulfurispirillum indicum]